MKYYGNNIILKYCYYRLIEDNVSFTVYTYLIGIIIIKLRVYARAHKTDFDNNTAQSSS